MSAEEELENQAFKVQDRRRFNPDGSPVAGASAEEKTDPLETTAEKTAPSPSSGSPEEIIRDIPADFSSLILSLTAGAQSALGISPHPLTGKPEKNLPQAKYSIDLLGMLQEKTRGNLGPEEAKLLEALLFDLRMRYVEAQTSS